LQSHQSGGTTAGIRTLVEVRTPQKAGQTSPQFRQEAKSRQSVRCESSMEIIICLREFDIRWRTPIRRAGTSADSRDFAANSRSIRTLDGHPHHSAVASCKRHQSQTLPSADLTVHRAARADFEIRRDMFLVKEIAFWCSKDNP
jgi:hypothetical protein